MERRPLTGRLVIMVVGFLLLIPIAGIIRGTGTNVVKSGGLPGAAVAADPLVTATTAAAAGAPSAVTATADSAATFVPAAASTSTAPAVATAGSHGDLSAQSSAAPTTAPKKTATTTATTAAPKKTATTTATTAAPKKAPATTAAPKPTSPRTTRAPATTAAASPPKTQATTTTTTADPAAVPPPNSYSKADVEAIIRSVWPADLADEAVRIAKRESNLVPTVRNWCCFGLFQIYFQMNKSTLAAIGVTAAQQLYDPRMNAEAAYAIYQRSGWGPWGQ